MIDTHLILTQPTQLQSEFGLHIEKAIVSLAFDHPELFLTAGRHFSPELFQSPEAQYVMTIILNALEEHNIVPTRGVARDYAIQQLNTDQPYAPILELIDRKSDPRETPMVKSQLIKWLKKKAYGLIYSDAAMNYYQAGDYEALEKIFEEARRITDFKVTGLWLLDNYNALFDENVIEHRTTGFPKLDAILNNGGPSPGEVVCWVAGTNVGKCSTLSTSILEKENSRIYELELEDGTIRQLAGFRAIKTTRGIIKVKDLTEDDSIVEIPDRCDSWDLVL